MLEDIKEKMKTPEAEDVKLTKYSHGAGCGCKISPKVLDGILRNVINYGDAFPHLLIGNKDRDDAAVMDLGDGTAIISTTDFFMPIVDDPINFGKIAAANAISDIYAMGGKPILAIAILGWPINVLSEEIAGRVIEGANRICFEAGIPLAGGHSIDAPEPIFGLAVTGRVDIRNLKSNGGAKPGDVLFLTKPLGIGILTTAGKKGLLKAEHSGLATNVMLQLNSIGEQLGKSEGVHAMTDVTGFGLGGHLVEMCKASGTTAAIDFEKIPVIDPAVMDYIEKGCMPGGTQRNYESYGEQIGFSDFSQRNILCDPQTSGGLLIAAGAEQAIEVESILKGSNLWHKPIGRMLDRQDLLIYV